MHTHPRNPAPLVVRLRDLAPHLSPTARARLALDRIVDHSDQLDRAHDQAAAHAALAALRSANVAIADFTGTVVTSQAAVFGGPAVTTVSRCDLSDLPVDQCGCRIHRPGPSIIDVEPHHERVTPAFGRPVTARYPGRCPGCREPYDAGEMIRLDQANQATGEGRWWHDDCAQETSC